MLSGARSWRAAAHQVHTTPLGIGLDCSGRQDTAPQVMEAAARTALVASSRTRAGPQAARHRQAHGMRQREARTLRVTRSTHGPSPSSPGAAASSAASSSCPPGPAPLLLTCRGPGHMMMHRDCRHQDPASCQAATGLLLSAQVGRKEAHNC
jgi:hypothetical protein